MSQFAADSRKENAVAAFLDTHLYPHIASESERRTDEQSQRRGVDVTAKLADSDRAVAIDEKAQTDYINSPTKTFVLEIFGETYWRDGSLETATGWYIDDAIRTDYYLFVWPTRVSLFRTEPIQAGEPPVLVYRPADTDGFETEWERSPVLGGFLVQKSPDEYRMWCSAENRTRFEEHVEPLPAAIRTTERSARGRAHFDAENVRELKAVLVEKARIRTALDQHGLTRDVLREWGERVARSRSGETIETPLGTMRISYSDRNGENPVNLVVWYDVYHEVADETFVIRPGVLRRGERLFD